MWTNYVLIQLTNSLKISSLLQRQHPTIVLIVMRWGVSPFPTGMKFKTLQFIYFICYHSALQLLLHCILILLSNILLILGLISFHSNSRKMKRYNSLSRKYLDWEKNEKGKPVKVPVDMRSWLGHLLPWQEAAWLAKYLKMSLCGSATKQEMWSPAEPLSRLYLVPLQHQNK